MLAIWQQKFVMQNRIVTILYRGDHYEVYDHLKNETYTAVMGVKGNMDMTPLDAIRIAIKLINDYENERKLK